MSTQNIGLAPPPKCAEAQCTGTGTQSGPTRSRQWPLTWHGMMTPWESFFLNENLIHFEEGFEWTKFSKTEAAFKVFGGWRWSIVPRWNVSNVPTKQEKMANSFSFPSTCWPVNGQSSEWDVFCPRTSTATNKHPTRSFRSVGSGCRGAEALPKDLDEVRFFCQQTDKKGTFFHMAGGLIGWFFMLTHWAKWPSGLNFWGLHI